MTQGALISVVIPTWNRRQLVQEAIASVIAQTYRNWELIVVDDGSTDGTAEELRKIPDERIRVIAAAHCGSTAVSRNAGIDAAEGEFIAFLDSDDLWLPEKLERQLEGLTESRAGWCYCNYSLMDEQGREIPLRAGGYRALNGHIAASLLLGETAVCVNCLLIRREVLGEVGGFDPTLRKREDLDFDIRLALAADAIALREVLVRVRDHPNRKTAASDFAFEHTAKVYRNFISSGPERRLKRIARKMLAMHLADAATDRIAVGHFQIAGKLLAQSLFLGDAPGHWFLAGARGVRRLIER